MSAIEGNVDDPFFCGKVVVRPLFRLQRCTKRIYTVVEKSDVKCKEDGVRSSLICVARL